VEENYVEKEQKFYVEIFTRLYINSVVELKGKN
jgi:hypothetical protein